MLKTGGYMPIHVDLGVDDASNLNTGKFVSVRYRGSRSYMYFFISIYYMIILHTTKF